MSKLFSSILIVALLSIALAGCGEKVEETYILTTLREATRGDLLSPGFKYSFDNPNIIAMHKDLALVREGNLIELFIGQDLEPRLYSLSGKSFKILASKMFSPYVHFQVDYIVAGSDTIEIGPSMFMKPPRLINAVGYSPEGFEEVELDKLTSHRLKLKTIKDKKFLIPNGKLAFEEVNVKGSPTMLYTIHLKNVRFLVKDPSDGMQLIFKALIKENLYFDGGVSYENIPSRKFRKETDSGGFVTVEFVKYGGRILQK